MCKMLNPCPLKHYQNAVQRYINRCYSWENKNIDQYMKNARPYMTKYCSHNEYLLNRPTYLIKNSGIEYDYPHTLEDIIILPESADDKVIDHEIVHIYLNNAPRVHVECYMDTFNMVRINRQPLPGEITNPDTTYWCALKMNDSYLWCALFPFSYFGKNSNISHFGKNKTYIVRYYHTNQNMSRDATEDEIIWYNNRLPYRQNYHIEEIIAELFENKKMN